MPHVATALPDLTALDSEALRELVVEKQNEIESLKLLILKLQRMQFGRSSERLVHDIHQLELRLEDLETTSASKPTSAVLESILEPLKPARRLLLPSYRAKPRYCSPKTRSVRIAARRSADSAMMCVRSWSLCGRGSK